MIDTGAELYFAFRRVVDQLDGDEGLVSASKLGPAPCSSASARTLWSLDRLTVRAWLG
jgi:hypothetical protein